MDQRKTTTRALENVTCRKDLKHGVSSVWKEETEKTNTNNIKDIHKKDKNKLFFVPAIARRTKRLKLYKWMFIHWENSLTIWVFKSWNRQQGGV